MFSFASRRNSDSSNGKVEWYSGWINCFFPLISGRWNQWTEPYAFDIGYIQSGLKNDDKYGGIECNSFPLGLCHCDAVIGSANDNTNKAGNDDGSTTVNEMEKVDSGSIASNESNGYEENIKVVSGFVGFSQNPLNYCLSPCIGWFIVADNPHSNMNNEYDAHLDGISEDDEDGLLYAHNTGSVHIKTSDDSDSASNDDQYVGKKKKGKKNFMAIDKFDEEDEMHKELQKQTTKR